MINDDEKKSLIDPIDPIDPKLIESLSEFLFGKPEDILYIFIQAAQSDQVKDFTTLFKAVEEKAKNTETKLGIGSFAYLLRELTKDYYYKFSDRGINRWKNVKNYPKDSGDYLQIAQRVFMFLIEHVEKKEKQLPDKELLELLRLYARLVEIEQEQGVGNSGFSFFCIYSEEEDHAARRMGNCVENQKTIKSMKDLDLDKIEGNWFKTMVKDERFRKICKIKGLDELDKLSSKLQEEAKRENKKSFCVIS